MRLEEGEGSEEENREERGRGGGRKGRTGGRREREGRGRGKQGRKSRWSVLDGTLRSRRGGANVMNSYEK